MRNEIVLCGATADLNRLSRSFPAADVFVLIPDRPTSLSLKDESGKSKLLLSLSAATEDYPVALALVDTELFGKRKSALVFEKGRLTSVIDSNKARGEYSPGFGYGGVSFFDRKTGLKRRIGVAVGEDGADPECLRVLALQNDAIINLSAGFADFNAQSVACCVAYLWKIPAAYVTKQGVFAAKTGGGAIRATGGVAGLPLSARFACVKKRERI